MSSRVSRATTPVYQRLDLSCTLGWFGIDIVAADCAIPTGI